jgi:hypothetical protein
MNKKDLKERIFLAVVEDNADPKKIGRVRARVHSVYGSDIPKSDLPWARSQDKGGDGNIFSIPDIGKVVSVIFLDGDVHNPEYMYAEHYNINLENKLKALSDSDYKTFKGVMVDQSTQIYRSVSEGLKTDHEYSNMTLDPYGNICLNIRDDKSIITFGSKDASESIVLGDTWMTWFDSFVTNLLGANGGPYLGNMGAPIIANPAMIDCLTQYQNIRENFLSDHVKASQNGSIIAQKRPYINQFGDIVSTTDPNSNNLSTISGSPYSPNSSYQPYGQLDDNPASGDKYDPTKYNSGKPPKPFTGTASATQRKAIDISVNATLSHGQSKGKCARFTYNHAYNYVNALRNKSVNGGAPLSAGGNAKDKIYHNNLIKLGWIQVYTAEVSKSQISAELDKDYEIGDIICYCGLDGSSSSYARYGHTQMFTGGIPSISGGYKWSTDNATNYRSTFVYGSRPCEQWFIAVFKAPKA